MREGLAKPKNILEINIAASAETKAIYIYSCFHSSDQPLVIPVYTQNPGQDDKFYMSLRIDPSVNKFVVIFIFFIFFHRVIMVCVHTHLIISFIGLWLILISLFLPLVLRVQKVHADRFGGK